MVVDASSNFDRLKYHVLSYLFSLLLANLASDNMLTSHDLALL